LILQRKKILWKMKVLRKKGQFSAFNHSETTGTKEIIIRVMWMTKKQEILVTNMKSITRWRKTNNYLVLHSLSHAAELLLHDRFVKQSCWFVLLLGLTCSKNHSLILVPSLNGDSFLVCQTWLTNNKIRLKPQLIDFQII